VVDLTNVMKHICHILLQTHLSHIMKHILLQKAELHILIYSVF